MASRGINKVILVGNLGQEPEHRVLPSGGGVTNISIATSESWKDKNTGQMQERTEWHRVVFLIDWQRSLPSICVRALGLRRRLAPNTKVARPVRPRSLHD